MKKKLFLLSGRPFTPPPPPPAIKKILRLRRHKKTYIFSPKSTQSRNIIKGKTQTGGFVVELITIYKNKLNFHSEPLDGPTTKKNLRSLSGRFGRVVLNGRQDSDEFRCWTRWGRSPPRPLPRSPTSPTTSL